MAAAITLDRIIAVQAAYVRCIDSNALESWPDFFTDQCLYKVTTAENHKQGFEAGIIYADSKGMFAVCPLCVAAAAAAAKQAKEAEGTKAAAAGGAAAT